MFVTNYPRGYTKVGSCYSQTEKIASEFEYVRNRGDFVATNRHEIAASLHGRFVIATKIACVNGPLVWMYQRRTFHRKNWWAFPRDWFICKLCVLLLYFFYRHRNSKMFPLWLALIESHSSWLLLMTKSMAACCDGSKVAEILRAKLSGDLCDEGRYIYLSFMLIRQCR